MRTTTILIALTMLTTGLAGCTGDPDGGGNDEIDSDALQDLFDEHFEDFINNTTITVNNHYHNNTTVVNNDYDTNNDYNNTTNVDGGEINNYNQYNGSGAGSDSIMQMFTVNWAHSDVQIIDYGSRMVTLNDTLQQTSGNPNLLYALIYEGNLIEFENVNCEQFYNFAAISDTQWRLYLEYTYGGYADSEANQLEDFWRENAYYTNSNHPVNSNGETVRDQCPAFDGSSYEYYYTTVFEIELSMGEALDFLSLPNLDDIVLECDDGYAGSSSNGSVGGYLGGQADCTVSGIAQIRENLRYERTVWEWDSGNNSSSNIPSYIDTSNIPDWWWMSSWYYYGGSDGHTYSSTPIEFAVYFTTYFVEVYDE